MRGLEGDAKKAGSGAQKTERGIKDLAISLGLVKIGAAAFKVLASSMDTAIKRFDTLNQFPKVLQELGVSAEDSERAMARLSDGIDGLPTTLDDIASTAQRMYNSFKDIDKATDSALALNNALLASGADANEAQRGTDQYIKALQTGKMELDTWTTLQTTMGLGLTKVAEAFNMTEQEMYEALKSGQMSMDDFNDKMIELGTGAGELARIARTTSLGIGTSLKNLKNAAARGIADIISSFDDLVDNVTGKDIAENIDSLKQVINASFKAIGKAIEATTPIVILFANGIKGLIPIVKFLSPAIIGLASAYAALMVINKINSIIDKNSAVLQLAAFSGEKLTIALAAKTKATATDTVVQAANTGAITLGQAAIGVLTGNISLATVATGLLTTATTALSAAMTFLKSTMGLTLIVITAVVAAGVALVKWFNRSTESGEKLTKQQEQLVEEVDDLTSSIDNNSSAYKNQKTNINSSAKANQELVEKIKELSEIENKSAEDKQMLAGYIEQLNGQVDGLNLAYDEQANAMNLTSEELEKRVKLMQAEEAQMSAQERMNEIAEERNKAEEKLEEITENLKRYHQEKEDGLITGGEYNELVEKETEKQAELQERINALAEDYGIAQEDMKQALEDRSAVVETMTGKELILYETLGDSLQQTVDDMADSYQSLQEAATNAFDKIETKTDHTMESMIETLQHNQEVVAQWAENQATLMEWAGDQGYDNFIPYIESMGIDSAAELAVMVNGIENGELAEFASIMEKGADVGTDAFVQGIMDGDQASFEAIEHLMGGTEDALSDRIKKADFKNYGKNVGEGLAGGVTDSADQAIDAAGNMADDMTKKTKNTLQISSPSGVYKDIGTDVTDGLALGINDGTNKVTQALNELFKAMQTDTTRSFDSLVKDMDKAVKNMGKSLDKLNPLTQKAMTNMLNRLRTGSAQQVALMRNTSTQLVAPFNSTPARLRAVGMNAMSGLNAGLLSGRGRVLATARGIANSVASTMQRALRIHSPSRVMEDDVGRWIPEGLAEGIEANTDSVFNALDKMTGGMMKMTSPEVALGIAGGGTIGSYYYRTVNSNSTTDKRTIHHDNGVTIHIENIENNSDSDIPRILEESAWIMGRERGRLDG